jgi:hypothetical protein
MTRGAVGRWTSLVVGLGGGGGEGAVGLTLGLGPDTASLPRVITVTKPEVGRKYLHQPPRGIKAELYDLQTENLRNPRVRDHAPLGGGGSRIFGIQTACPSKQYPDRMGWGQHQTWWFSLLTHHSSLQNKKKYDTSPPPLVQGMPG